MASSTEGGSRIKRALERLAKMVNEWEREQYAKQKQKGQNERDQQR